MIYSFVNLPDYEVWKCEVSGRSVKINQFKQRYECIELVDRVPREKVRELALAEEEKVGYKLSEVIFPIDPFKIEAGPVTDEEVKLLEEWRSVLASFISPYPSVWVSVNNSFYGSNWGLVGDIVKRGIGSSVKSLVWGYIQKLPSNPGYISAWDSVRNATSAYISSLFPGIKKWEYIEHPEGKNPFQPCIDLWRKGFVPVYNGKVWMLCTGKGIVWKERKHG